MINIADIGKTSTIQQLKRRKDDRFKVNNIENILI